MLDRRSTFIFLSHTIHILNNLFSLVMNMSVESGHDHSHDHTHSRSSADSFFQGPPKTMFMFGVLAGVAGCSILVLAVVAWAIFGGKNLNLGGGTQQVAVQPTPNPADNGQQPTPSPAGPVKPVNEKADHIKGPKNAKVTLIEYSDFQCPFCNRHFATLQDLMKQYPNDVRLVYRHYPLSFHPFAQKLAEGSECANELGGPDAFWKYHDHIFQQMAAGTFTDAAQTVTGAKDVGLNSDKFKTCLDSGKYAALVAQDEQDGQAAGVEGTPGTFVNGKMISGAVPLAQLKAAVDAALKK